MRGYDTLIQEAELMSMSPDGVATVLKERADKPKSLFREVIDSETEAALHGRNEPLIDLYLARYALHIETLTELFWRASPGSPIRLACLANRAIGDTPLLFFPVSLFGNVERMFEWLNQATESELSALFENPCLNDNFFSNILRRKHGWERLTDEKLRQIISILSHNSRMQTPRDDEWLDGLADYHYSEVFAAAWSIAETIEPTEAFAIALGWLYEELRTEAHPDMDPLKVAARWQAIDAGETAAKREAADNDNGALGNFQRVRKGLARLAVSKDRSLLPKLLESDDLALRCCAYGLARMSPEQILAAQERDGEIALNEMTFNQNIWRSAAQRQALHDAAWKIAEADKNSDLLAVNIYQSMKQKMEADHPQWFSDEDDVTNVTVDTVVTRRDLAALSETLAGQKQAAIHITDAIDRLTVRSRWILWFSLGALVASLLHY